MSDPQPSRTWNESLALLLERRVLVMLLLGFSAGIPILLIFSSLSLWLKEAEVSRSTITFFSWAALGYSFKFIWAPLVDMLPVPLLTRTLGRRRGWLLASQIAVIISILAIAMSEPTETLLFTALAAVMLGFSSATQDIVIDAYRIESAPSDMQPLLSSAYIAGYRLGMITAGAGALYIADWFGSGEAYSPEAWTIAYSCMAAAMLLGVFTTLSISEPENYNEINPAFKDSSKILRFLFCFVFCVAVFVLLFTLLAPLAGIMKTYLLVAVELSEPLAGFFSGVTRLWFAIVAAAVAAWGLIKVDVVPREMVIAGYIDPIADFLRHYGKPAIAILLLISLYRVADVVMGVIANLFYSDLGFSKTEIATYSKLYGLIATLVGGFVGGIIAIRYGVLRALLIGAILSAVTNILFAYLAIQDKSGYLLMMAITADNLSAGIAMTAFVAYLSSLTSLSFTAMQYAIFSSLTMLFPTVLKGFAGSMSESMGYENFFYLTAILGVPAIVLVLVIGRLIPEEIAARTQ